MRVENGQLNPPETGMLLTKHSEDETQRRRYISNIGQINSYL